MPWGFLIHPFEMPLVICAAFMAVKSAVVVKIAKIDVKRADPSFPPEKKMSTVLRLTGNPET